MKPHPSQTALIVVDGINGFLAPQARLSMTSKGVADIFPRMNKVIEAARKEGIPVIYLCDGHYITDEEIAPGKWPGHCYRRTWESQVHPEISQPVKKKEWVFKQAFSAFKTSGLHEKLQALGVKKLVVLGVATEYCDEANSTDAVDLGYDVTVVSDSIREVDLTPGDGDRAVWRMAQKGIKFRDTVKVIDAINRHEYEMPFEVPPTNFPIGPSKPANARPIVTEAMVGNQAEWIASLNYRREPRPNWLTQTDFYQITMAYFFTQVCRFNTPVAHFEAFIRKLPPERQFMILSGLRETLYWLKTARMTKDRIDFIMEQPIIQEAVGDKQAFRDYLENYRFKLDLWSFPEGAFFMPIEPYVGVSGPIEQVLWLETYLLSMFNSRSAYSTNAALYTLANPTVDAIAMEMRRMDARLSEDASLEAWLQGFIGSSNTEAAFQYGWRIPKGLKAIGTNSHAAYLAFCREMAMIQAWMEIFPNHPMVLADTFHTLINALKTADVLRALGRDATSYRVDSSHLVKLMELYARILGDQGIRPLGQIATNDLTPALLAEMLEQHANATAIGAGTKYGEVRATPGVLKLSEIDGPFGSK
jgi:nicotinate phosphoribosyltransferase